MAATTTANLSTSARAGFTLATSAFAAALNAVFALTELRPSTSIYNGAIALSLMLFGIGIVLVIRDPMGRKLGLKLLVNFLPFGDGLHRLGYIMTISGAAMLAALLIQGQANPWYSKDIFQHDVPYVIFGFSVYFVGWLLVLRPRRKKAAL